MDLVGKITRRLLDIALSLAKALVVRDIKLIRSTDRVALLAQHKTIIEQYTSAAKSVPPLSPTI